MHVERDKMFAENQAKMMAMMEDIQQNMFRLSSRCDMKKKVNIDNFFPIKDDAQLEKFLDKSDGDFQVRRDEFEHYLYCHVTRNLKLKRPFETDLLSTVFNRDYISSHRWPGQWYFLVITS